jgi:hypothetical protein
MYHPHTQPHSSAVVGFGGERQSVATPQAARGRARPPCRYFKIQSCVRAGSDFSRWKPYSLTCRRRTSSAPFSRMRFASASILFSFVPCSAHPAWVSAQCSARRI